ncbi:delta and Notch-like epidermal growth factor-related receptor isoform X1 [Lepisosteus oculatus]|uniref:delta and Notch-like epidermal growth factor-related receptor isoform X1 n=1 Tax=Lepisosteus oculatus TaxID=7918 RepID=UPI0035F50341
MPSLLQLLVLLSIGYCLSKPLATLPPDPCEGKPCLNNATCVPSAGTSPEIQAYNCTCSPGFTGQNCEFFADPCTSSPCLHGDCSSSGGGGYSCVCKEGYQGELCDQALHTASVASSEASPSPSPEQPSLAPATSLPPTTVPTTVQAAPTLQPWQPQPGQNVVELLWEAKQITPESVCGNTSLNESTGTQSFSLEVPEETSVKIKVNITGFPTLWKVSEHGFKESSVSEGRNIPFLQAVDGLVLSEDALPPGSNYFIGFLNESGKSVVTLRLHLNVKVSNCVEPGSSFNDPQCSGKGKCITQPTKTAFYCDCEQAYSGIFCEEFDACYENLCENNGSCIDLRQGADGRNFTCTCQPGYTGKRCQALIDHCISQPCKNGGTCSSSVSGYSCQCPEGFLGSACEQKIDPCASSPCQNNGSCYSDGLSYSCNCGPGYTGPTCAQLIDFCALNPCAHGICRSVGTSYKCLCIPGYHGLYCEEEYNECLSAPCQNAATCKDLVNGYECLCSSEYEGKHCELYKDPCLKTTCQNGGTCESEGLNATCLCPPGFLGENCDVDINECDSNPCHHGGTCIDQSNGFICHCPQGWVGTNCEIHLQWKSSRTAETLSNMPRHSLYIIIGALCVAFVLMLIILIVGICRISRIEYQGSSRPAYEEFYNCRSIDSELSNAIASIRHARFGKKSRPAMYDATPIAYEDYSPDDKPLVTLIKTKDL